MFKPFLQLKNISHSFNNIAVLKDISFDVRTGDFVAIVGQSGLGKTTLLKIISGLLSPQEGRVLLQGSKTCLSYVFQTPTLLPWKNVLENVLLPLKIANKNISAKDREKALRLLDVVELKAQYCALPQELSEGQKQRVSLARALITNPNLLLMDEPFASLDAMTRERLQLLLLKLWKETKATIIFVTHSISEAALLAKRIVVLDGFPSSVHEIIKVPVKENQDFFLASTKVSQVIAKIRRKVLYLWEKPSNEFNENKMVKTAQKRIWPYYLTSFGLLVIFVFAVDFMRSFWDVPAYIWPSLLDVFFVFSESGNFVRLLPYIVSTITASLIGFVFSFFSALILGYILAQSKFLEKLFMPYLIAFQVIPIIAYAPLLINWFGLGLLAKIYTASLISFFPMLINTLRGLRNLDENLVFLTKLLKANRIQAFWEFEFPASLPFIFSGMRVGIVFSLVGAVVGEFMAGNQGVGHLINIFRTNLNTAGVVLCMGILLVIGMFFQIVLKILEKIIIKWTSNKGGLL